MMARKSEGTEALTLLQSPEGEEARRNLTGFFLVLLEWNAEETPAGGADSVPTLPKAG